MVGLITLALLSLTCVVVDVIALAIPSAHDLTRRSSSSNINNCSGTVAPYSLSYNSYFSEYTRQIDRFELGGWESWTFVLSGISNGSLSVFTWSIGDPAAFISNPAGKATFSAFVSEISFSAVYEDYLVYNQVTDTLIDIGIGNNHLIFDGSLGPYGGWNVSVDIQGLVLDVISIPVPADVPFAPSHSGVSSQLVSNYFTNIPMTRGHTDGTITFPNGQPLEVHDVTTVKHSWATNAVQHLLSSYTRGTSFVLGTSVNWFNAKSVSGQVTNSAQLLVDQAGDVLIDLDIPVVYQVTDDSSLLTISPNGLSTTLTFIGCAQTQNNPYVFTESPLIYRGSVIDSAGGTTKYYNTATQGSFWLGNAPFVDNSSSLGIIEVYAAPA